MFVIPVYQQRSCTRRSCWRRLNIVRTTGLADALSWRLIAPIHTRIRTPMNGETKYRKDNSITRHSLQLHERSSVHVLVCQLRLDALILCPRRRGHVPPTNTTSARQRQYNFMESTSLCESRSIDISPTLFISRCEKSPNNNCTKLLVKPPLQKLMKLAGVQHFHESHRSSKYDQTKRQQYL